MSDDAQMTPQADGNDPFLEAYEYDSMFGSAEVFCVETDDGQPLRCLYVDGGFQTATFLGEDRFQLPFAYCKAFDIMFRMERPAQNVLLIGGGAFSYPKHVLTTWPSASMDVVEIDPVIIDIARKHFFLDELEAMAGSRLRSFAEDGMNFLRNAEPGAYDAIVNDSFAGTVQDAPLLSPEGLQLAKRALRQGGMYLLNAVVDEEEHPKKAAAELKRITCALEGAFACVRRNDVEDEEFYGCINHIFIASDSPL